MMMMVMIIILNLCINYTCTETDSGSWRFK